MNVFYVERFRSEEDLTGGHYGIGGGKHTRIRANEEFDTGTANGRNGPSRSSLERISAGQSAAWWASFC